MELVRIVVLWNKTGCKNRALNVEQRDWNLKSSEWICNLKCCRNLCPLQNHTSRCDQDQVTFTENISINIGCFKTNLRFRRPFLFTVLKSRRKDYGAWALVPTQISCPHFFPSGFFAMGQVFSGLRLTAFISVVSGSSTLPDFSLASFFSNIFQFTLRSVDPE